MQDTGAYQRSGNQEPARSAEYGTTGYGRPAPSRTGAALAILAGALAFLEGLAFVIRSHFYPTVSGYAYRWTLHGWGWVLLVLGALLFAGGVSSLLEIKGSRYFAGAMAVVTAVIAFLTIFYSAVWSIVVVAACAYAAYNLLSNRGAGDVGYGTGGQDYGSMSHRDREKAASHRR
jgi:hypothetical protein